MRRSSRNHRPRNPGSRVISREHKELLFVLSRKFVRARLFYPELYGSIVSVDYALQGISSPGARNIVTRTINFLERFHTGNFGMTTRESELAGELRSIFRSTGISVINAKGVCNDRFYLTGTCTCARVPDCLNDFMVADGLPLPANLPFPEGSENPGVREIYNYWTGVPVRNVARAANAGSPLRS